MFFCFCLFCFHFFGFMVYCFWVIKLDCLFKNVTTYSKKVYDEFLNFHAKTFSLKYHVFSLLISMLFLFLIMLYVQNGYYGLAVIFCTCLTSFILYRYFHPIEEVCKEYHSKKITQKQCFTFSFYKGYFKVYTKREYSIISYQKIYKIYETDTFFYLYLDHRHSFLLDKSGFKKGDPLTFRDFIKKNCPFKFKLDTKKRV